MMNIYLKIVLTAAGVALLITLLSAGIRNLGIAKEPTPPKGPIAKVRVLKAGVITFDGTRVDLEQLHARLKKLKEADGAVWYYRESADEKAEHTGEAVIKTIMEVKIPVRLMDDHAN